MSCTAFFLKTLPKFLDKIMIWESHEKKNMKNKLIEFQVLLSNKLIK
jgi:hypothetical protein